MSTGPTAPAGGAILVPNCTTGQITVKVCTLCDKPYYAKGFCQMHYRRLWRHGSEFAVMPIGKASPNYGKRAEKLAS